MKKKSVCLLASNILLTFFFITLATYLAFVIKMLFDKADKGENLGNALVLGHLPALFLIVGAIVLFVSLFIGWIAFAVNNVVATKADAVALSIGNGLLLLGALAAYINNPSYVFVSFLFTVFFCPSTALAWVSFLRRK